MPYIRSLSAIQGHVLLVEPDATLADHILEALHGAGLEAELCAEPRRAVEVAEQTQPDIVVAELLMPGLDGLTLYVRLRERKLPVPMILLSAKESAIDRVIGLRLGIADWLTKPFDMDEMVARVQAILRRASPQLKRPVAATLTGHVGRGTASPLI